MSQFKLPSAVARNIAKIEEMERANRIVHGESPEGTETIEVSTVDPVVEVAPVVQPVVQSEDFEHKFKTLQGMFNAEKRRSQELLVNAEERVKALENQLVTVEKSVPRKWDIRKYIPAEELENYDEKQLETVLKATMSASSDELDLRIKQEMKPLKDELENAKLAAKNIAKDAFFTALEVGCENWNEINQDPKFHAWLSEVDEITGVERQSALSAAEGRLDSKRVLAIFKAFQRTLVARPDPRDALASKVMPDVNVPSSPNTVSNGGEWFTRSQIRKFYDDCRRGNVYTTSQQTDMERRLQAALNAGRIKD